jgi:glycosyltransferase involved in cell wall biosynthesis
VTDLRHPDTPRVKVVRIIARLNVGGPARHVVLLNAGLDALGYDTLLVYGSVAAGEASLEQMAESYAIRRVKIPELGPRISPLDDLRAFARLTALLFCETPDVIHTHTAKAGTLGRLAAVIFNMTRRPSRRAVVVHTFHGHVFEGYFHPAVNAGVRAVERTLAAMSDRIVAISPRQRADIVDRLRVTPAANTVTVPLGLDLDRLLRMPEHSPNLRETLRIPSEACVVGFVGRLVPIKAVDVLLRACAAAQRRQPALYLLVVGDGPLRADLEALATTLGIMPVVRFIGWTDDLPRVYATMDVCALSSINEGTPVALIEAMAAGRAVAATAVGGVPDVLADGKAGRLVPPGDTNALADALADLAGDAAERARLGHLGRAHVAERFAASRLVRDIDSLYREALDARRPG